MNVYTAYILTANVDTVNMEVSPRRGRGQTKRSRGDRYHHGHLREALIDAALVRLRDTGQPRLSLRELARDVGVTVNASYRHFADKDALLDAVAAEGFRRFAAQQEAVRQSGGTHRERTLALGRGYVEFARAHPALFRLMFTRSGRSDGNAELEAAATSAFQPLLDSAGEALALPAHDERVVGTALAAWALVHGLSLLLLDQQVPRVADDPERFVELALRAIRFDPAAL